MLRRCIGDVHRRGTRGVCVPRVTTQLPDRFSAERPRHLPVNHESHADAVIWQAYQIVSLKDRCEFSRKVTGIVCAHPKTDQRSRVSNDRIADRRRQLTQVSSARAGRAEVLLNLCERDHHHHWIDWTPLKSGMCIKALRVV